MIFETVSTFSAVAAAIAACGLAMRAPRPGTHRTRLAPSAQGQVPSVTWTAAIAAGNVVLTTLIPVVVSGLPLSLKVQGVSPISWTQVSATQINLHYAAAVVTTNVLTVGQSEPNIRSAVGGYLANGTFTFP